MSLAAGTVQEEDLTLLFQPRWGIRGVRGPVPARPHGHSHQTPSPFLGSLLPPLPRVVQELTHSSCQAGGKPVLTEPPQEGRLPHSGVAHKHNFEEPVWDGGGGFLLWMADRLLADRLLAWPPAPPPATTCPSTSPYRVQGKAGTWPVDHTRKGTPVLGTRSFGL